MTRKQSLSPVPGTIHSVPFVELPQALLSQVETISPFVDQFMRYVLNFRHADGSEVEIETALREALANAVVHGNRENSEKLVYVECRCYTDGEVSITVRDEGQGFDSETLSNPTNPEKRLFTHGRGIYLMKTSMDELSFDKDGVVVRMRKKSRSAEQRRSE